MKGNKPLFVFHNWEFWVPLQHQHLVGTSGSVLYTFTPVISSCQEVIEGRSCNADLALNFSIPQILLLATRLWYISPIIDYLESLFKRPLSFLVYYSKNIKKGLDRMFIQFRHSAVNYRFAFEIFRNSVQVKRTFHRMPDYNYIRFPHFSLNCTCRINKRFSFCNLLLDRKSKNVSKSWHLYI